MAMNGTRPDAEAARGACGVVTVGRQRARPSPPPGGEALAAAASQHLDLGGGLPGRDQGAQPAGTRHPSPRT
jgi:hypothetical protein